MTRSLSFEDDKIREPGLVHLLLCLMGAVLSYTFAISELGIVYNAVKSNLVYDGLSLNEIAGWGVAFLTFGILFLYLCYNGVRRNLSWKEHTPFLPVRLVCRAIAIVYIVLGLGSVALVWLGHPANGYLWPFVPGAGAFFLELFFRNLDRDFEAAQTAR